MLKGLETKFVKPFSNLWCISSGSTDFSIRQFVGGLYELKWRASLQYLHWLSSLRTPEPYHNGPPLMIQCWRTFSSLSPLVYAGLYLFRVFYRFLNMFFFLKSSRLEKGGDANVLSFLILRFRLASIQWLKSTEHFLPLKEEGTKFLTKIRWRNFRVSWCGPRDLRCSYLRISERIQSRFNRGLWF